MKTLLFFAPIDAGIEVNYTPDDHIPEDKIEEYGLTDDAKYQFLDNVWDVDSECYCVWRPTLQEACDVAMERFKQNVQARYEDALDWDNEVQALTWEEFWAEFADDAQALIDEVLAIAG